MRSILLILVAGACGSKTPSAAAARIVDGDDVDLTDCTFLQRVKGTASDDDANAQTDAKNQAKEKAAALGATHIRWLVPCCTSVEGEAYRCDTPD